MDDRGLQGWARDPFQLHESRYFSVGRPTKLVRDGNVETYDDPPSAPRNPPDAPPRLPPAAPAAPAASAASAPPQSEEYAGPLRRVGGPGRREPGPDFAPRPPRRPRAGLFVAAAMIVLVAVLAGVKLVDGSGSGSATQPGQALPTSPVAFVTRSAEQTLAERTVDTSLSGTLQIAGASIAVNGTGETSFSTDAMAFDLHANAPGGALDETELLVNGNLYYTLTVNGTNMAQLAGGRKWIQMPVQESASANLVGSDPVTSLSTLEQQGSTVRVLGTQVIGGVTCTGYAVTPSTQAMLAGARAESANLEVSSATTNQELQQIKGMSPPTITVWIDAHGIVQEMSINLQINVDGTADSADMTMDFSHFGVPVTVTAPAPSETISFSSFVQNLDHGGAT
jgi:hypothetical protein